MKLNLNRTFYWISFAWYIYIIGPAAVKKIIQWQQMMDSMQSLGFDKNWTIGIGIMETIGVVVVLAGLLKPTLRTLGVLFLFPFAIGAFTAHMAHQEYHHFYNSLIMCVLSAVLLVLDKRIKIFTHEDKSNVVSSIH
ncbi:DoxX family protein [Chryseobacterium paridis]|uniref:DoxX family protein n=1 Tax=Chryseobacterium paridis TaxID=2800328 RepID=A0ABS1FW62_9FLAO|nr:DoxX family protein [Chryseobacterium paridis]MBK1896655.1 DoxX family protein [Chryseobacterium paridis]